MREKTAITFETFQDQSHDRQYKFTHVVIRTMYRMNTRESLEGTVDNKAGYGSDEACRRQGILYQDLLNLGHAEHFDVCTFGDLDIHIVYQHYFPEDGGEMDYCRPRFESTGEGFRQMGVGLKLLGRIGRGVG